MLSSSSPGDLQPVFDALLANATRLCEASYGGCGYAREDRFALSPRTGRCRKPFWREADRNGIVNDPDLYMARAVRSGRPVQVDDLRKVPAYLAGHPVQVSAADIAGIRTFVVVPMFKDKEAGRQYRSSTARSSTVHRQTDRSGHELRRPSRHRHRECAVAQRTTPAHHGSHGSVGTADGHGGGAASHQPLAWRFESVLQPFSRKRRVCARQGSELFSVGTVTSTTRRCYNASPDLR